jgi:hypothetical protein
MSEKFDHRKIMERILGEKEQPVIKRIPSKENVFEIDKNYQEQTENSNESKLIIDSEMMEKIEKGALEFKNQEDLIEKALKGEITSEELTELHPYYGVKFKKKPVADEKKKKPLDDSLKLKFK